MKSGDKLVERKIADQMGVSRTTITRAFNLLREHGFLDSDMRFSTRVSKNVNELVKNIVDWQQITARSNIKDNCDYYEQKIYENTRANSYIGMMTFNNSEFKNFDFFYEVIQSVTREEMAEMFYQQSAQGLLALRRETANFIKRYGINTYPDNITIFSGYMEALNCVISTLLTSNTIVLHNKYSIAQFYAPLSMKNILCCPVDADNEGILPNNLINRLSKHKNRKCIVLMEDTTSASQARLQKIYQICAKEHAIIVEMCTNRDIFYDLPSTPLVGNSDHPVVHIGAPCITMDIGAKFAWVITPEQLTQAVVNSKMQMFYANSTWEIFCWKMLQNGRYSRYLDSLKSMLQKREKAISNALNKYFANYAEWLHEEVLFKSIKLRRNVKYDTSLIKKHECLGYTLVMNIPDLIHIESISVTVEELCGVLKELSDSMFIA